MVGKLTKDDRPLVLKAAELKHKGAAKRVGEAYLYGKGVPQDEVEANKWFRLAAQ